MTDEEIKVLLEETKKQLKELEQKELEIRAQIEKTGYKPVEADLLKARELLSDEEREILDTNGASLRIDKEKHEASRQALNVRSRRAMRI